MCCLVRFVLFMLEAWIAGLYFACVCFHYTFCYGCSILFVCANTQKHCVVFVLPHLQLFVYKVLLDFSFVDFLFVFKVCTFVAILYPHGHFPFGMHSDYGQCPIDN